jgi:hypothetical protein
MSYAPEAPVSGAWQAATAPSASCYGGKLQVILWPFVGERGEYRRVSDS